MSKSISIKFLPVTKINRIAFMKNVKNARDIKSNFSSPMRRKEIIEIMKSNNDMPAITTTANVINSLILTPPSFQNAGRI